MTGTGLKTLIKSYWSPGTERLRKCKISRVREIFCTFIAIIGIENLSFFLENLGLKILESGPSLVILQP